MNRGFTLFELIVSIGIFAMMTALVVAKYGNFNQSTLLTDTAYDIALALHSAQNYGIAVRGNGGNFTSPYGIDFDTSPGGYSCGTAMSNYKRIVLYADGPSPDGICTGTDTAVTPYVITRGATLAPSITTPPPLSGLCVGAGTCTIYNIVQLDVSFTRPNPEAKICASTDHSSFTCTYTYAEVTVQGTDGSTRTIAIRQNGQISVASSTQP